MCHSDPDITVWFIHNGMLQSFMLAIRYSRTFGEKIKRASVQNIKTWEKFVEKLLTRWTSVYGRLFHIFNSHLAIYKNLFMFSNVKNYIGDMLCAGGGCSLAIATRCCTAWDKFKKLLPLLTSKHISLSARGRVFMCTLCLVAWQWNLGHDWCGP